MVSSPVNGRRGAGIGHPRELQRATIGRAIYERRWSHTRNGRRLGVIVRLNERFVVPGIRPRSRGFFQTRRTSHPTFPPVCVGTPSGRR
jgi:hypothetical protein